ncbi:MAG: LysE family transporter [Pseudomonadota bacterium]
MTFLLSVAAIWTVAAVTPGPNFFLVLKTSALQGRRAALVTTFGICCGTLAWGVAGWLGISAAFEAAPVLYVLLKTAGAIYLLWLGLTALWAVWRREEPLQPAAAPDTGPRNSTFLKGLFTNLANPKTAIFVSSLFAATLPPDLGWQAGAGAVLIMVTISLSWYSAVALFFASGRVAATLRAGRRALNAVAGTVFVVFGARLAVSD